MRLGYRFSVLFSVAVCLAPFQATSQELSRAKVCVAVVNNHTAELLSPDRMTVRLVKAVSDKKLSVVAMDSATGNSKELRPTLENSQEMKSKECDYLLLTMVTGSSKRGDSPSIVPSTDASDPMGGQSGPVYRSEIEVNFAVFRSGGLNPILDTQILDRPRANASDSLMDAMDREGNRVKHKLEKK
jgi:hypothetical protein